VIDREKEKGEKSPAKSADNSCTGIPEPAATDNFSKYRGCDSRQTKYEVNTCQSRPGNQYHAITDRPEEYGYGNNNNLIKNRVLLCILQGQRDHSLSD
jgi:hypothetical protein